MLAYRVHFFPKTKTALLARLKLNNVRRRNSKTQCKAENRTRRLPADEKRPYWYLVTLAGFLFWALALPEKAFNIHTLPQALNSNYESLITIAQIPSIQFLGTPSAKPVESLQAHVFFVTLSEQLSIRLSILGVVFLIPI